MKAGTLMGRRAVVTMIALTSALVIAWLTVIPSASYTHLVTNSFTHRILVRAIAENSKGIESTWQSAGPTVEVAAGATVKYSAAHPSGSTLFFVGYGMGYHLITRPEGASINYELPLENITDLSELLKRGAPVSLLRF